jgi:hypothetical protein
MRRWANGIIRSGASRGSLRRSWRLNPLKDRILDECRVARDYERHRVAGVQQHVEVGDLLSEGDEHRPLSGGDLHQEPVAVSLLAYDLTFDMFTGPATRLGKIRRDQRGSSVRHAEADDHADKERADENDPSPHLMAASCAVIL